MIIKGRCRSNGSQLADYLQNSKENERAQVIAISGTATPNNLKKSLLEMSLTSELSSRTDDGLYHAQLSPRAHEAATMTDQQKTRMVEILTECLEIQGHKFAVVEHEKEGRIHWHTTYERYDHETGKMWNDENNYAKHKAASRQMEMEFGWQITHDKTNHLDKGIKAHILNLWNKNQDPAEFAKAINKAGFEVVQGIHNRPYQIVDQHGTVHDLTRQLKGVKQADVAHHLNPIRSELRTTTEACKEHRQNEQMRQQQAELDRSQKTAAKLIRDHKAEQPTPERSDKSRELSDSQDRMAALKVNYKQKAEPEKEQPATYSYSFKIQQPPALPRQPQPEKQPDKSRELSDSQDLAAVMLKQRQAQAERDQKIQEAKQQAKTQTEPANDNDPLAKFRINKEDDKLAQFRSQKNERTRANERTRERGHDD